MASLAVTNTLAAGQTISASPLNTNFSDIVTYINNRNSASATWDAWKVSANTSNPAEIKSSAATCELDIDCTGSNGVPFISFRRSGTTYFSLGVDGAATNLLKLGTTGITTNTIFNVPTAGNQIRFANGSVAAPGVAFIGDSSYGMGYSSSTVFMTANGASGGFVQCYSNGDVLTTQQTTLATGATAGFLFVPAIGGTPTGSVTNYTGSSALAVDTTGSKIWVRIGSSWKSVAVA